MSDPVRVLADAAQIARFAAEQSQKREQLLDGMGAIIRRMTRVAPTGALCLIDYSERELAVKLLKFIEGQ